jgi:hypothetical protein
VRGWRPVRQIRICEYMFNDLSQILMISRLGETIPIITRALARYIKCCTRHRTSHFPKQSARVSYMFNDLSLTDKNDFTLRHDQHQSTQLIRPNPTTWVYVQWSVMDIRNTGTGTLAQPGRREREKGQAISLIVRGWRPVRQIRICEYMFNDLSQILMISGLGITRTKN